MFATRSFRHAPIRSRNYPIAENELAQLAPSVFAERAHASRSARYAYIPTIDVLRGLGKEGFQPFSACEARARSEDKVGYTKHMIRLRHADQLAQSARVGDSVNEIVLINSHDGASAYRMMAGCFRFVCANGMVVGNTHADVHVKHSGKAIAAVVEGAYSILEGFDAVDASKDGFRALQLTDGEQRAFGRAALALRFDGDKPAPIDVEAVIQPRRWEDRGDSLWHTLNRAQENLVRGGIRTNDTRRRTRTRAVNGIDGNLALNRALWTLAEEMRKLRTVAA